MTRLNLHRTLATTAVAVGLLVAAAPAGAATQHDVIAYTGHAGLAASVYQHNQTDLEFLIQDGTSNTIQF
jgi:hypothetical protein